MIVDCTVQPTYLSFWFSGEHHSSALTGQAIVWIFHFKIPSISEWCGCGVKKKNTASIPCHWTFVLALQHYEWYCSGCCCVAIYATEHVCFSWMVRQFWRRNSFYVPIKNVSLSSYYGRTYSLWKYENYSASEYYMRNSAIDTWNMA